MCLVVAGAETMQWSAVDLCGSAPESRLDFATCTLRLRLPADDGTKSSCVSRLQHTDPVPGCQQAVVRCPGIRQSLYYTRSDVMPMTHVPEIGTENLYQKTGTINRHENTALFYSLVLETFGTRLHVRHARNR